MASAYAHVCRTKARKSERLFFELRRDVNMNDSIGRLLNRMSDYFFVLARAFNKESGIEDIAWKQTVGLGI
jgi:cob(I)alamin adenosyltransferase